MDVRAAVAHRAGAPLSIETVRLDGPRAGEVLIEIKATGICHTDEFTLSGADPHHLFDRGDEDLPIADLLGACGLADGIDDLRHAVVRCEHGDLHLGQEVGCVLGPAVQFRVALLAAESLDLAHRQALHPDARERRFDIIELDRLDNRLDLLPMAPIDLSSCGS